MANDGAAMVYTTAGTLNSVAETSGSTLADIAQITDASAVCTAAAAVSPVQLPHLILP